MCFSVDVFLSCGIVFFFLKSYYIELLELRDSVIYDCHSLRALVSYYSSVLTRCPPWPNSTQGLLSPPPWWPSLLALRCPIVARIFLSQFRENPQRWYLITLACIQQESCQFSENPSFPLMFPFSSFLSINPTLLLGYKLPLIHATFRIEPSSIQRSLFSYCNSFWIKSVFTTLLSSSGFLWKYLSTSILTRI